MSCPELGKSRPNVDGLCLTEAPPTPVDRVLCDRVLRLLTEEDFCDGRGSRVFSARSRYCACRITCSRSCSMFRCMAVGGGAWGGVWGADVAVDVWVRSGVGGVIDTAGVEGGISCVDTSVLGCAITGIDCTGAGAGRTGLRTGIIGKDTWFEEETKIGVVCGVVTTGNTDKTVC